jgi:hypothetical protein
VYCERSSTLGIMFFDELDSICKWPKARGDSSSDAEGETVRVVKYLPNSNRDERKEKYLYYQVAVVHSKRHAL